MAKKPSKKEPAKSKVPIRGNGRGQIPKRPIHQPPTESECERILMAAKVFEEAIEDHIQNHPNIEIETLLWVLEFSFKQLRHYLEVEKIKGVSWKSPSVGFNWPIQWDWDGWTEFGAAPDVYCEPFTAENTRTDKQLKSVVAKAMTTLITMTSLHHFTNFVGLEKTGSSYTPIISPDVTKKLARIRSLHARQERFEALYQPFSLGCSLVELDEAELNGESPISKTKGRKPLRREGNVPLPPIEILVDHDGMKMKILLYLQIHPFVVDAPKRSAYFPITVGFFILPDSDGEDFLRALEDPRLNPSTWSSKSRNEFWRVLFKCVTDLQNEYAIGTKDEMKEAFVEVTAKLKIKLLPGESNPTARVMQEIAKSFAETGEVIQAEVQECNRALSPIHTDREELARLLERVENETDNNKKGEALEELASRLFGSVKGFQVSRRQRTDTEEIDLLIINSSEESRWKNESPVILVECKNWSSKCGKNELVQFRAKVENRRGKCRLGFLVSWNGFASTVSDEQKRSSREDTVIALITGEDVRKAVQSGQFLYILQESWNAAVLQ